MSTHRLDVLELQDGRISITVKEKRILALTPREAGYIGRRLLEWATDHRVNQGEGTKPQQRFGGVADLSTKPN